jgi:hypothetical protein
MVVGSALAMNRFIACLRGSFQSADPNQAREVPSPGGPVSHFSESSQDASQLAVAEALRIFLQVPDLSLREARIARVQLWEAKYGLICPF